MMLLSTPRVVICSLLLVVAVAQSIDEQQTVRRRVYGELEGLRNLNTQQLNELSLDVETDEEIYRLLKVDSSVPPVSSRLDLPINTNPTLIIFLRILSTRSF